MPATRRRRYTALMDMIVSALFDLLGPHGCTDSREDMAPWLTDWRGIYRGSARCMVSPASLAEVQAVVALAARHRVPLVPQGGNTSMVGGATPDNSGDAIIVSMRRMNRITAIDHGSASVTAEAGVILASLHDAVAGAAMRFPLTLGARGSATIGGLISTNAGGTQVLRYGPMRSLVLGLQAVLPDASLLDRLVPLKKDNRGYDPAPLLIGGEGTLGITPAATLRLVPAAGGRCVAWVGLDGPAAALALLRRLEAGIDAAIEGFEILPAESLDAVLRHIPGTRAPLEGRHRWHVLVEGVAASADAASAALERALAGAIADGLIDDAAIAQSEAQADAFWRLRDSLSEAERALGPALQHDISVPVERMPAFMIDAARQVEARFPGVSASGFGHLGDGNVHFHVRAPACAGPDWRAREGPAITRAVHDLVVASGGSISAEHGIGQMKRDELARLDPPARIAAMRAIKAALDPHGIMNPGKLVP